MSKIADTPYGNMVDVPLVSEGGDPTPSNTVTGPPAFGGSPAAGSASTYSRGDHAHGLPSDPDPAPSDTVTGPPTFGESSAAGSSASFSRGDHVHGLPSLAGGSTRVETFPFDFHTTAGEAINAFVLHAGDQIVYLQVSVLIPWNGTSPTMWLLGPANGVSGFSLQGGDQQQGSSPFFTPDYVAALGTNTGLVLNPTAGDENFYFTYDDGSGGDPGSTVGTAVLAVVIAPGIADHA